MDDESNNDTMRFLDVLKAVPTQHVEGPTHVAVHIIDLLITRSSDAFLTSIRINIPHMSDHSAIHCTLRLAKPPNIQVTMTSRSYRHVSTAAICDDIQSLLLSKHLPDDMNYAVDMHSETIGVIIDKHALLTTRTETARPHTLGILIAYDHKSVLDVSWNENGEQADWSVRGWLTAFSLSRHPYTVQHWNTT